MAAADFACPAIAIRDLVKVYAGGKRALDGITVDVPQGQIFGLLGPNGAGKSTTVRALATLTRPDGGRALVAGHDVVREAGAVRRAIGYVPALWGAGSLSVASLLFSFVGCCAGVWLGLRVSES